ncbi:MBL fold metallo-hydrolase [Deinococcus cavernae]|uniref:MBL fold metallo-hydrolase n=1 Tax=Deinococcus cavernae TaxID=2320857 RepID=UPI001314C00D|nr:MBL fold metallo-hydrolase [Deinococcus cavernae]
MSRNRISFFERPYPDANSVLIHGKRPTLVDTGFGSGVHELESWLTAQGVCAARLALIVNTHHHTDHVGGNHHLQTHHGTPIAAHPWEGRAVNRRDPEACLGRWLTQPVQAYHVTQFLRDGDTLNAGDSTWHVLHTPGHSLGHIVLHREGVGITGDALMTGDIGWLNFHRDGLNSAERALESLDRLAALNLEVAYPGHGPVITDVPSTINAARTRTEKMLRNPMKAAWHGTKRIFAFALMSEGPMTEQDLHAYQARNPWITDYARDVFHVTPTEFFTQLLGEMTRSGAARWEGDHLIITGPYRQATPGWARTPTNVSDWPPAPAEWT